MCVCVCAARSGTDSQPIRPLALPYRECHRVGRQLPGEALGQQSAAPNIFIVLLYYILVLELAGGGRKAYEPTDRPAPPPRGDTRIVACGGTGALTGAGEVGTLLPAHPSVGGTYQVKNQCRKC